MCEDQTIWPVGERKKMMTKNINALPLPRGMDPSTFQFVRWIHLLDCNSKSAKTCVSDALGKSYSQKT